MDLDHNISLLIIQGDWKFIIDLATKIINGKYPQKITPSWCLLGPLNSLKEVLRPSLTLTTSYIRRSTNTVADRLGNAGFDSMQEVIFIDTKVVTNFVSLDLIHGASPIGMPCPGWGAT